MKKIKLTNNEFLSLYTGIHLTDNFMDIMNAFEKVFDKDFYDLEMIDMGAEFVDYIDKKYEELADAVKKLGEIKFDKQADIKDQIDDLMERFKEITGKDYIEIEPIKNDKEIEME